MVDPLLERHLLYVTGKGGVGKTTVSAALGLAAAAQGRRTIVCEVAEQDRVSRAFAREGVRREQEVELAENLWAISIDPTAALQEWLRRQLGGPALRLITGSSAFQHFVAAAPGAKELITIAKVWELAQLERWDAHNRTYDLVIVDAPASGHGLAMLTAPSTFGEIARVGPIRRQAFKVRDMLADPRRTGYVAVALPEEMPVNETLELGDAAARRGRRSGSTRSSSTGSTRPVQRQGGRRAARAPRRTDCDPSALAARAGGARRARARADAALAPAPAQARGRGARPHAAVPVRRRGRARRSTATLRGQARARPALGGRAGQPERRAWSRSARATALIAGRPVLPRRTARKMRRSSGALRHPPHAHAGHPAGAPERRQQRDRLAGGHELLEHGEVVGAVAEVGLEPAERAAGADERVVERGARARRAQRSSASAASGTVSGVGRARRVVARGARARAGRGRRRGTTATGRAARGA